VESLVVPVAPSASPSAHTVYYTTRRGDTLVSVADRFGISLTQLRRWNKLPSTGTKIVAGRRLHVAEPTVTRASTTRRRTKGQGSHTRDVAAADAPAHEDSAVPHHASSKTRPNQKTHTSSPPSSKRKRGAVSSKHPSHAKSPSSVKK
jgi:membrane-bound lytic murein transglycosylase D